MENNSTGLIYHMPIHGPTTHNINLFPLNSIVSKQEVCSWILWHVKPHEKTGHQAITAEMWLEWEIWNEISPSWCEFGTSQWGLWWSATNVGLQTCTFWRPDLEPQNYENSVLDISFRNPNHSTDTAGWLLNGSRLYLLCKSWPCSELGLWHTVRQNWHPLRYVCVVTHRVFRAHFPFSVCQLIATGSLILSLERLR